MAVFGIKSDDIVAVFIDADRDLQFVPVLKLTVALDRERDLHFDPRYFAEGVVHGFAFQLQLRSVAKVLDLTAAALGKNRTAGAHAFVGGSKDLQSLCVPDAVLYL